MKARAVWVWWTSGKDAAWALRSLRSESTWEARGLLAAVTEEDARSWLHGVRRELLARQAAAVGLPLKTIRVDPRADPPRYDAAVRAACREIRREGGRFMAFGDLSSSRRLLRRTQLLQGSGLEAVFPLWGRRSLAHVREMLGNGLIARVCSLVPTDLPVSRVGSRFDESFLEGLPPHVDPCGENDEFHTFVEWAPGWRGRVPVAPGRRFERYGLAMVDLPPPDIADSGTPNAAETRRPSLSEATPPGTGPSDPFVYFRRLRRVREHVTMNLDGDLAVARVAAVAGLAPSSFGRWFRGRTGVTYGAWLIDRRIDRASRMLRESDIDVGDVARAVGYPVARSFRRAFRRRVGCSPATYRRSYLAGRPAEGPKRGGGGG